MKSRDISNEKREWMYKNLKRGMVIKGKVKVVKPYGAFVEIAEGVDGILFKEDISSVSVEDASERLKKNQIIDVMIKKFDRDTGKITLTRKELLGTWEENASKFKEKTEVDGIARVRNRGGILVELAPNLIGMAEHKVGVLYGDKVRVFIKKISPETKKIKLVILD